MALETRGRNGPYYYKKVREGDRVLSVYQGSGDAARLEYELDQLRRQEAETAREAERAAIEAEKMRNAAQDAPADRFCEAAAELTDAIFLIHGYHKHSRAWRRGKRG